ncbi:hypothetical protein SEA_PUPPER_209 [Gordonia phage Pupper]|uniref:Uncharacterized protein n=1 Tax=Gordonia phage Pupper TaxID=2571249 RepID=A0A4Y6EKX9_9CAUD|nr:hypothetical protein KHQ83_gp068 [Gordonia phage Pupper]QDF18695.1 hypothetical protein SEA_PUPPER_209 [Gordonia phage Pupper]
MMGRNGWDTMAVLHDSATKLFTNDGSAQVRVEYNEGQMVICITDWSAPKDKRHVSIRVARGGEREVAVGTGEYLKDAGQQSLDRWMEGEVVEP